MRHTVQQIAQALGLRMEGAGDLQIVAAAEPADAGPDDLAIAMKPAFAAQLPQGRARAAILWDGADWRELGLEAALLAPRPRFALAGLSALLDDGADYGTGVSPHAVIHPQANIGEGCTIAPFTVIGRGAQIGAGSVIGPQCYIGADSTLGAGAMLHAGVRIAHGVHIGARFVAQPGAVVGGDGFSFVTAEPSGVEKARASLGGEGTAEAQAWSRIHSLGGVEVGDDVEIGANSCIDRGTIRATRVGTGTKIDNLVQIGHNVTIGQHCLLCAGAGVAGSSVIGNHVVLGGQSGVSDNITVGDNVIAGGGTKILSKVPAGRVLLGYPAVKMDQHIEIYKATRRLPRLLREVAELQKAVSKLMARD